MHTNRLLSSVLLSFLCLSFATAVHAKSGDEEAARRRLSDNMRDAQKLNRFKDVNKYFGKLEKLKKVKLCWDYYQMAAEASRNLNEIEQILVRYWKARGAIANGNAHCNAATGSAIDTIKNTIKADQASWGRVRLRAYKSSVIESVEPLYTPEAQAAVEDANKHIAQRGAYTGFLPVGTYTVKASERSKKARKLLLVKGKKRKKKKRFTVKVSKWSSAKACITKQDSAKRLRHEKCMKKVKPQKINLKRK